MERETIYGQVVSKANNYEIGNDKHGQRYIIKSEAMRAYERNFMNQCKVYKDRLINCHFTLYVAVYESSVRYDLDNALKTTAATWPAACASSRKKFSILPYPP